MKTIMEQGTSYRVCPVCKSRNIIGDVWFYECFDCGNVSACLGVRKKVNKNNG